MKFKAYLHGQTPKEQFRWPNIQVIGVSEKE